MPWVLAVDFGTSSTAAAAGFDGSQHVVGVDGGLPRMLSNVFWDEHQGRLLLGTLADNAAAGAPWCFERTPKRKLGQEFMLLGSEQVRVAEAVGAILRKVSEDATVSRGGERPSVVRLTHPVRWGDERQKALLEAAAVAGLGEPELVLEPVAAATHYAHAELRPGEYVAVYDLGGGTFDTAVLQRTESDFEVVGVPGGRDGLGGEAFDDRLYRFLGEQLPSEDWQRLRTGPAADNSAETVETQSWSQANREFQRRVGRAKELLTNNPQAPLFVPAPVGRNLLVTEEDLNGLIRKDLEWSVDELGRTIASAGLEPSQLSAIYLAGGTSQIPLATRLIHDRLGVVPKQLNDPKAVVCLGAAHTAPRPRPSPVWSRAPELQGQARVGQRLSLTPGSVQSDQTIDLSYAWQRAAPDAVAAIVAEIPGAANDSYVLASADAGQLVRATVTASNADGSSAISTEWSTPVEAGEQQRGGQQRGGEQRGGEQRGGEQRGGEQRGERQRAPARRSALLTPAVFVTGAGALAVVIAPFLHYYAIGRTAWAAAPKIYPLGITLMAVLVAALLAAGIARKSRVMPLAAVAVAIVLLGETFWFTQLRSYTSHPGLLGAGYWLAVVGALVALGGAVLGARSALSGKARAGKLSAPAPAVAGFPIVALVGPAIVFVSLFLTYAFSENAWRFWPTRYGLGVTLLCVLIGVLVLGGLRTGRRAALAGAAGVSLLLLAEVFPLWLGRYHGFKAGFWLGIVGAAVSVLATIYVAVRAKGEAGPTRTTADPVGAEAA